MFLHPLSLKKPWVRVRLAGYICLWFSHIAFHHMNRTRKLVFFSFCFKQQDLVQYTFIQTFMANVNIKSTVDKLRNKKLKWFDCPRTRCNDSSSFEGQDSSQTHKGTHYILGLRSPESQGIRQSHSVITNWKISSSGHMVLLLLVY